MSQYRKIRTQDLDGAQEVEYNFGRLFHQIGQPFPVLEREHILIRQRFVLACRTTLREGTGDCGEKNRRDSKGMDSVIVGMAWLAS